MRHWPGLLLSLSFFIVGLFILRDFGSTIDEWNSLSTGRGNLVIIENALSGEEISPWADQEIPGYSFPLDTLNAWVDRWIPWGVTRGFYSEKVRGFRLLQSALTIFLLYLIVVEITGRRRTGFFAAAALALLPQFIAHSQNNPKDLPATFTFTLAIYFMVRLVHRWDRISLGGAGLTCGLAFVTRCLAPLILPITGIWIYFFHNDSLSRRRKQYAIFVGLTLASTFFMWPWIWTGTLRKLVWTAQHLANFKFNNMEVYLGEIYRSETLPWHYFLGNFLAFTPSFYLFFSFASLLFYRGEQPTEKKWRSLTTLGWMWTTLPMIVEGFASARYNSLRHFMFLFPGFCLLVAAGMEYIMLQAEPHIKKYAWGIALIPFAYGLERMVYMHPHEGAYLNEITNVLIPASSENYFSIEYFGSAFREGANFLNANAEKDAEIFAMFFPHCAQRFLNRKLSKDPERLFFDESTPKYLMYITRVSRYTNFIHEVENHYEPVYTIHRQKGTLLKIYKNTSKSKKNNPAP